MAAKARKVTVLAGLLLLGAGGSALALTPEQRAQLPADATGRIEQRLREVPVPPPTGPAPSLQVEPQPVEEAPDSAANIPLQIEVLKLTGVTAYKLEELEPYWRDRIGKPGTLGDLFAIASAITVRYRNDGYVLSRAIVPAQEIEDGRVELRIIEGYVDKVIFEGDDDRPDLLRGYGENITDVRPVRIADLERYLLLIGDGPGVGVSSVLKPSQDQTGAADLIIKIERELLQPFTTVDNRGTRYVGPVQYTMGARINSLFGLGDATFVRGIMTPEFHNELIAFDLNNQQTLNAEGTTLGVLLNYAEARPGFSLTTSKIISNATTAALVLAHPIVRSRIENLRINLTFAANQYKTTSELSQTVVVHDNIRSVRLGAIYEAYDKWRGANIFALQFSQGLNIFDATKTGSENISRVLGRSDYSKLTLDVSRLQSLGGGWNLLAAATAQHAFTPLLASEQFGLGGSTFLRAYDPSDIIGDSGIGAKFELQYGEQPKTWYLQDYTAYAFFDLGRTQNLITQPGEKSSDAGISFGVGTRFTLTESVSGYVEASQPYMRGVPTQGTNHNHFARIFFAFIAKF
ncbi:MAG: ShlB/FhaC/HecB family hemolysin secretion/activation protein [Proteobacteria bacterium]|nr:ShlB/FhaC/HecB family hemolysin secretion/activation protein [Pseudomonadota bacterium]